MAFASGFPSTLTLTPPDQDLYTSWPEVLQAVKKRWYWWGLKDKKQICDPWKAALSLLVPSEAREWRKNDPSPSLLSVWLYSLFAFFPEKKKNACSGFPWCFSIQLQYILKSGGNPHRFQLSVLVFDIDKSFHISSVSLEFKWEAGKHYLIAFLWD